jgi:Tfp pilus assembly protein PilV
MKRYWLSTFVLLIVIGVLGVALVMQQRRADRLEARLQAIAAEREATRIKAEANFRLAQDELKRRGMGAAQQSK